MPTADYLTGPLLTLAIPIALFIVVLVWLGLATKRASRRSRN